MPHSPDFLNLKKNISTLEKAFLPRRLSPTGSYRSKVYQHAREFYILCHSEIEHYTEQASLKIALGCVQRIAKGKRPDKFISSMLAWYLLECETDEETIQRKKSAKNNFFKSFKKMFEVIYDLYRKHIEKNHGIRENNLKTILGPIGLDLNKLDQAWVNNMDSFGQTRGDHAHQSLGVIKLIDPSIAKQTVRDLLSGLSDLDYELNKLLKIK